VTPTSPLGGSMKSVFTYDYMGRRVRKQIYLYSGGAWNSTPTIDRKFIYDGWNLLLELNALSSDAVLEKYTWGLDLSGQHGNQSRDRQGVIPGLHDAGGIGGLLSMRDVGTTTSLLYMYSANGDVAQLVKASDGSFGAKYQYYPYGGEIGAVGSYAGTNPFRLSTKYWDAEQQAYYYGYRYHKPKLGRWLNRDPLEEDGGVNLHAHTHNSPANLADPLGLACKIGDPCWGGPSSPPSTQPKRPPWWCPGGISVSCKVKPYDPNTLGCFSAKGECVVCTISSCIFSFTVVACHITSGCTGEGCKKLSPQPGTCQIRDFQTCKTIPGNPPTLKCGSGQACRCIIFIVLPA